MSQKNSLLFNGICSIFFSFPFDVNQKFINIDNKRKKLGKSSSYLCITGGTFRLLIELDTPLFEPTSLMQFLFHFKNLEKKYVKMQRPCILVFSHIKSG